MCYNERFSVCVKPQDNECFHDKVNIHQITRMQCKKITSLGCSPNSPNTLSFILAKFGHIFITIALYS